MKRYYYAFVGGFATYGTPHPRTGRLSVYGKLFCFNSKRERNEFCDTFNTEFNQYPHPTNKKEAKVLYFGGICKQSFEDQIAALNSGIVSFI